MKGYLTYWHNRNIEADKMRAQKEEEEEFNSRIRQLVITELNAMSNMLNDLLIHEEQRLRESKDLIVIWRTMPLQYTKLSLERRAKIFDAETYSL
jgi:hypothetical protein